MQKAKGQGMEKAKNKDIRGYRIDHEIVCPDCMKQSEIKECKEADLILVQDREDNAYWCDRCNKLVQ